jgi:cation diffusion facilitator CzcD-associated flavoprotein CzcO
VPESFSKAQSGQIPITNGDPQAGEKQGIKLDIAIIGAGVGGLASAIALKRGGHKVTVYEQAPALGEVGLVSLSLRTRHSSLISMPFSATKQSTKNQC